MHQYQPTNSYYFLRWVKEFSSEPNNNSSRLQQFRRMGEKGCLLFVSFLNNKQYYWSSDVVMTMTMIRSYFKRRITMYVVIMWIFEFSCCSAAVFLSFFLIILSSFNFSNPMKRVAREQSGCPLTFC